MNTEILNPLAPEGTTRLSSETRNLAYRYLTGEFRSRLKPFPRNVDPSMFPAGTPPSEIHAFCAKMLASESPLCIECSELLAGSAPNAQALEHLVPGYPERSAVSHTTVDLGDALRKGLSGLEKELDFISADTLPDARKNFAKSLLTVIEAMRIWIKRYVSAYRSMAASETEYAACFREIADRLERVPEYPPENFADALQSLWCFWEFQRLCGNWSGLGRFDLILGDFLKRDLEQGRTTLSEARERLAHFWIKGTEWCYGLLKNHPGKPVWGGDAQVYQNIILGGTAPDGCSQVENEITFLVLDIVEELHISDFPVTVRLNRKSSERLFRRVADLQLLGGGIVSVYNEKTVLEGLEKFGYTHSEALNFTNDGCWEVIIPGRTRFSYTPFDILQVFQKALFRPEIPFSFEDLYARFLAEMEAENKNIRKSIRERWEQKKEVNSGPWGFLCGDCEAVLSLLEPDCRKNLRSYTDFGPEYAVQAIHAGGLPDVANSLYAVQKLVFAPSPLLSMKDLIQILKSDWKDHEYLRLKAVSILRCYGNNDPESDAMMKRVYDDYVRIFGGEKEAGRILTPLGISTFGREIQFASKRSAVAFGKFAHEYLAPNLSPTPGTEKESLSDVVNSYCKMDFTLVPNGCPLDLRLSADIRNLPGASGILVGILKVFLEKGGFYFQLDTVDAAMLEAAKKNPDRFPNLVVRISGWSARFASLSSEWQDMIIRRTALGSV